MTGRIILGVVLALILLFLFSNVRLVFRYDNGEVFLQARWLFIRYQILPEPEKRKKKGAGDEKKESTNGRLLGRDPLWRERRPNGTIRTRTGKSRRANRIAPKRREEPVPGRRRIP